MKCRECLIWQNTVEANKQRQLTTVPALARLNFVDIPALNQLYINLDREFKILVSIMDNECTNSRCILIYKGGNHGK